MAKISPSGSNDENGSEARSPLALGYMWATIIMTMGIELALPVLLGAYLDFRLGTVCLFLILGVFLGSMVMVLNFIKLMKSKGFQNVTQKVKRQNEDKTGD